jgi:hypothetical protein
MKTIHLDETKSFKYPLSENPNLVRSQKKVSDELTIAKLDPTSFFGEEILFKKHHHYEYTIKVSSMSAKILALQRNKFVTRFPRVVYHGLHQLYKDKRKLHIDILTDIL